MVRRKTGFNSRTDLLKVTGCWSNGKTPGLHPGIRGSIPIRVTECKKTSVMSAAAGTNRRMPAKWWNGRHATLRTSCPHGRASSTLALATRTLQVRQVSNWLSYGRFARLDTGTCNLTRMGQCSFGPHKPESPGATPGSATCETTRYANRQSGHVEGVAILWVRLPLWSLRTRSRGPTAKTPGRHPGKCWFDSSRDHF